MATRITEKEYNENVLHTTKCLLEGCNNRVPYNMRGTGYCCTNHKNVATAIRKGNATIEDYTFKCQLCDAVFSSNYTLSRHLIKEHKLTQAQQEEYYNKYVRTENDPDGHCKWCGKPTKFNTIGTGYDKFCGSRCGVLWNNQNSGRLEKASKSMKNTMARGDVTATQLGYWLKKGLSEEEAREALRKRQTTNSVETIMERDGLSLEDAIEKRRCITEKWAESRFTGRQWSYESQELFWAVWETIKHSGISPEDVFFATFCKGVKTPDDFMGTMEYSVSVPNKAKRRLDFYIKSLNVNIEYDGQWFHDTPGWGRDDAARDPIVREALPGISILHITADELKKDKLGTIMKCLEFINQHKVVAS